MDLVDMLPTLESIARDINFAPLDDLLDKIREIVDRLILTLTPDAPVRDAGLALLGYADRFGDLHTQLTNSLPQLQDVYSGPASAQYYATVGQTLQAMGTMHDHLNNATQYHTKLAEHCLEALVQQGLLIAQAGIMAVDLGSLIFTAGLDAPVSVPVAAGDAVAAGGSVVAMDAAVDAAASTVEVIGESAADLGEMSADLGGEGADVFADGDTLAGEGDPMGDPESTPPGDPQEPLGGRGPDGEGTVKGQYSGRDFNPDEAGGPIQDPPLNPQDANITDEGIQQIEQHLSRFGDDPANNAMISRLRQIANGEIEPSPQDYNFYTHELDEFGRYTNLGYETGVPGDPDAAGALWNNTHTAALEDYGLRDWIPDGSGGRLYQLYDPSVWDLFE